MTRWYEDITIDEVYPLGSHRFTETEILDYARSYDPLPIHMSGPDIVASGWHVATAQRNTWRPRLKLADLPMGVKSAIIHRRVVGFFGITELGHDASRGHSSPRPCGSHRGLRGRFDRP